MYRHWDITQWKATLQLCRNPCHAYNTVLNPPMGTLPGPFSTISEKRARSTTWYIKPVSEPVRQLKITSSGIFDQKHVLE
ncbi:hypothetical protein PsYK624_003780 [Phanerochaete sordida]|uniref:Uncharacterized protein n=1 Tax=Phanerochaete sordida TaxID=48140 RepID=A0A9P3FXH0_9APHY|nr:hypothetical protein PsYK624_003780 [Phanerochaete sordida]